MPATNPRISAVVDPELAAWLERRSRAENRSVSQVVRQILAERFAEDEERFLAAAGEERLRSFDSAEAVEHDDAWGPES